MKLIQKTPDIELKGKHDIIIAAECAIRNNTFRNLSMLPKIKTNGKTSLFYVNDFIRKNFRTKYHHIFPLNDRFPLNNVPNELSNVRAFIKLKHIYLYIENGEYFSFENHDDEEIAHIWVLR